MWTDYPELRDPAQLIALMRTPLKVAAIARRLGCTEKTIRVAMRHHGIHRPLITIGDETRRWLNLP